MKKVISILVLLTFLPFSIAVANPGSLKKCQNAEIEAILAIDNDTLLVNEGLATLLNEYATICQNEKISTRNNDFKQYKNNYLYSLKSSHENSELAKKQKIESEIDGSSVLSALLLVGLIGILVLTSDGSAQEEDDGY